MQLLCCICALAILDSLLRALHKSIQSIGIPAHTTDCTTLQNTRLIYTLLGESKKGGGLICADLPARMVGERPNGAQRRLLGHADVPSCGTPMLSDRCSLNIRKKAISLHFCSLSLSRNIERYEFLVKHSILAPTTRSAAGFKYGFLFSTCWPPNF